MLAAPYDRLHRDLARFMPRERLVTDPLRTLAYGTDASFYRLVPKIVAIVESERKSPASSRVPCASDPGDLPRCRHQPLRPGDQRLGADRAGG